ncbi:murein biosynthesis integral membrane protein MurJ [Patescibacteria group bacterium]|nr:murein biosynthesis integral membrane protein MurJ [Patescibacteria group bacterium]
MFKLKDFWQNGRSLLVRRQSGILSAALVIALTYGISMVLGIMRERLIVARFYACCSQQVDVYYAAFRLPDMIFQLVVIGALSAAFIPVFSEVQSKNQKDANHLASSLINLLLGFFLILSVIIFMAAKPFSSLITGNFSPWQIELMAKMTRVMLFAQIFFLVSNFFSAISQSNQRFLLPSLSPIVYNLGIILSVYFFSSSLGIWSATIGVLAGAFFHLLIQIPLVIGLGFRYSFVLDIAHSGVKKVVKLMLPRTLSLAAGQIEATVSLFLATSLSAGSLTIYYLAQKLSDLPVRLLGTSIGQAALPLLSLQMAENKTDEFKKTLGQSLNQILFFALPVTAIFLVLRVQIVRFAYGAESFPWVATIITGRTLAAITFSIFSQSASQLLVRGYYALHDTKTPFFISLFSVGINVILSLFLVFTFKLEIFGLALAFSASSFIHFALLLFVFNSNKLKFLDGNDFAVWLKMIFSAVLAALSSWGSMKFLDATVFETTRVLPLLMLTIISGVLGAIIYFLMVALFELQELKIIFGIGRKISQWRKSLVPVKEIIGPHTEGVSKV